MKTTIFTILILSNVLQSYGQHPGNIDIGFGNSGLTTTIFKNEFDVTAIELYPDGSIIVGGISRDVNFTDFFTITKYDKNGIIDSAFNHDGIVYFIPENLNIISLQDLKIQNDGKIIVVGNLYDNSKLHPCLFRLNVNGSLDSTFGGNGYLILTPVEAAKETTSVSLHIQNNQKIIITGYLEKSKFMVYAMRLLTNGDIDSTFCINGVLSDDPSPSGSNDFFVCATVIQPDGKILFGGYINYDYKMFIARYNKQGSIDSTFGVDGISVYPVDQWSNDIMKIILTVDNEIFVAIDHSYGYGYDGAMMKFNSSGIIDSTFGSDGILLNEYSFQDVDIQTNGKIVSGPGLCRYLANGDLDKSFGKLGNVNTNTLVVRRIIQPDGKIITCGSTGCGFGIERYYGDETYSPYQSGCSCIVYPNPFSDDFNVQFTNTLPANAVLKIFDMTGRQVKEMQFNNEIAGFYISDTQNLERGIYTVMIESDGKYYSSIVIKL